MHKTGHSAELQPDLEVAQDSKHEPVDAQARHRKSSFFQRNVEGDERGLQYLLVEGAC